MRINRVLGCAAVIFLCGGFGFNADNFNEKIVRTLKKFIEEFPQEKVFLHIDKTYYLSGESIWFKAYLTAGSFNQLSPLSKTLYVELINSKNEKVSTRIIQIKDGVGWGDISLLADLPSGNYLLRAYTNWMRNFSQNFFYQHEVKIWNLDSPQARLSEKERKSIDIQFFAEGGNLVEGLKSNLAIKAIGADGLSRNIKGKIFTISGQLVSEFECSHLGMGLTTIVPIKDESYYAEIKEEPGKRYPIPKTETNGFIITITNKPEQADVVVKIQTNKTPLSPQVLNLVAHGRGELTYFTQISLSNVVIFAKIPKVKLLNGLSHITLFDGNGKPICNRLIYLDKNENLKISVRGLKPTYMPREKIEFDIETTAIDQPMASFLSLSTINLNESLINIYQSDITNYITLSSDLMGNIESPGYYFDLKNNDRLAKLDLLLLTQGWSRFSWNQILNEQWPTVSQYIQQGINIKGELVDELTKAPVEGGKVTFFTPSNLADIIATPTGKGGKFVFDGLVFYDSSNVVLQGENKRGKKFVKFKLDSLYPNQSVNYSFLSFNEALTDFEKTLLKKGDERRKMDASYTLGNNAIVLQSVDIKEKKIDAVADSRIYMGASKKIYAEKVLGAAYLNHPLELIRSVAGVQLRPDPPGYSVTIRGVGSISAGTAPLILLDNVPIQISTLNTIPVNSIASVDVFKGPDAAVFGSQGANGVIAFFSKKGTNAPFETKGVYSFDLRGYNTATEFYSPKYDVKNQEHARPDRRVSIQWLPNIVTQEDGKIHVSFFNPDQEATVQIQIQGITKNGLVGTANLNYEIKD